MSGWQGRPARRRPGVVGVGAGIGVGAAFAPISAPAAGVAAVLVPLAVENGQGVMGQYADQLVGEWVDVGHDSHDDAATEAAHVLKRQIYFAGEQNSAAPVTVFRKMHGINYTDDFMQELTITSIMGYDMGSQRDAQQGNLPQVG